MRRSVTAAIALLFCAITVLPVEAARRKSSRQLDDAKQVELFAAMESGDVELKFIPKNAEQAVVIIENRTKDDLQIQMPDAFAAVPVLAQGAGGIGNDPGGGAYGGSSSGGSNVNQGVGGGFGGGLGGGGLGGGGFGGGGLFNVAAEKTGKLKVTTVCLEHGKPDPNPRVPYAIKPIKSFTENGEVIELCRMLGRGELDQGSAQAAAWHMTDGLTWQQLARKVKVRHLHGSVEMYFHPVQIRKAVVAAARATQLARAKAKESIPSPGELDEIAQTE